MHSHLANVATAIGEADLRACEGTQAVLAIFGKLPEGNLRVLGCIGSLSKTHTGVTAHLWTASGCPAPENGIGNKKTATAHSRHQMPVKLHSSLCVFFEFVILSIKDFTNQKLQSQ